MQHCCFCCADAGCIGIVWAQSHSEVVRVAESHRMVFEVAEKAVLGDLASGVVLIVCAHDRD